MQDTLDTLTWAGFEDTITTLAINDYDMYRSEYFISGVLTFDQVTQPLTHTDQMPLMPLTSLLCALLQRPAGFSRAASMTGPFIPGQSLSPMKYGSINGLFRQYHTRALTPT